MDAITRRLASACLASTLAAVAAPAVVRAQTRRKPLRMLLNTSTSGPQAWFYLAEDKGYLKREGLAVEFTPGSGAYTAAPRMAASDFDIGYGDINSLIEVVARDPANAPVAVFVTFNASPSTVAVDPNGAIKSPKDLEGKVLIGHSSDVALKTFGVLCRESGVDAARVEIRSSWGGMAGMVEEVVQGRGAHGVFGYVSTLASALAAAGMQPDKVVRHLKFADYAPSLYGSCLMVSRRLLREDREAVAGVVRAFNAGIRDVAADMEAGVDAVMRRLPGGQREVEKLRLLTTLRIEMAHAEGRRLGIGDVDEARFARSIALLSAANALPRVPRPDDVFVRDVLPPLSERVTTLAS